MIRSTYQTLLILGGGDGDKTGNKDDASQWKCQSHSQPDPEPDSLPDSPEPLLLPRAPAEPLDEDVGPPGPAVEVAEADAAKEATNLPNKVKLGC